jgi:hypothetical protein
VEAEAAVAAAAGEPETAAALLQEAADRFDRAGHPLDVERCRAAVLRVSGER